MNYKYLVYFKVGGSKSIYVVQCRVLLFDYTTKLLAIPLIYESFFIGSLHYI